MQPRPVQIWKNFSGRAVAVDRAEIRPQVVGLITDIRFEDGQRVEKGDVLMVIDPRPYMAALNQAKAALEAAKTRASLAEKEYQRAYKLIETDTVSKRILDERTSTRQTAGAEVQEAKALLEKAEIDLDYAYIKAPISGKVGRAELTEGNLVEAGGSAPILTTIVADDRIYVDFDVDEQTYLRFIRRHADGERTIPVRITLAEGALEYEGNVDSFDNMIDPASGTIRARAVFENTDHILLPGMSMTVRMGANGDDRYILVPERAIGTDQDRKFVYIAGEDDVVAYREIEVGESVNGSRIVISGLSAGDRVIVEGIMKIQPGMTVAPQLMEGAEP
ncbi:MAG: efflux RND transporter periplasmic adaptor subunit [Alphaproteobacteria bacterium]|nr:efflux RND transporter periplasmic adaptor subunit [Alphaproteobacteria bacterium]